MTLSSLDTKTYGTIKEKNGSHFEETSNENVALSDKLRDVKEAKGTALICAVLGITGTRGVFMASSLLHLAQQAAIDKCGQNFKDDESCTIYGFNPKSVATSSSALAFLMVALFMPLIGAILDFTDYRRAVGIACSCALLSIQIVEVWTNQQTWFFMGIAESITIFLLFVLTMIQHAYFPEIASKIGEKSMTEFVSVIQTIYFGSAFLFLLFIGGIAIKYNLDDVMIGRVSQICAIFPLGIILYSAWKELPTVEPKQHLGDGQVLLFAGFLQIRKTFQMLRTDLETILWFFCAVIFTSAVSVSMPAILITIIFEQLDGSAKNAAIMVAIVAFSAALGAPVATFVSKRFNPTKGWIVSMLSFCITTTISFFVLNSPEDMSMLYLFSCIWGFTFGIFLVTETLIFSMLIPQDHEAGLSGFYMYCRNIAAFLPPLMASIMISNGVALGYSLLQLVVFMSIAIIFVLKMPQWDEIVSMNGEQEV